MPKVKSFAPGDRVRFTGEFLRNTGQYTGPEGKLRFTVRACECASPCLPAGYVRVDQPADLDFYTPDEVAGQPCLKWRAIAAANI
jgi:hypothetical protein